MKTFAEYCARPEPPLEGYVVLPVAVNPVTRRDADAAAERAALAGEFLKWLNPVNPVCLRSAR